MFIFGNQLVRCFVTHKLVLVREGKNIWTKKRRWPGWLDPRLSSQGIRQSLQCGKLLKSNGYQFDEVYTSVLTRSIQCYNKICDQLDLFYVPITKTWRLNEKHYGALQGESKPEVKENYGDLVQGWRGSLHGKPPSIQADHPSHPQFDYRYAGVDPKLLPSSESLYEVVNRLEPLWREELLPKIKSGKKILIVSHGNTLRAFAYMMTQMSEQDLEQFYVPYAIPLVYTFNEDMKPINYHYLGDQGDIIYKIDRVKDQTGQQDQI